MAKADGGSVSEEIASAESPTSEPEVVIAPAEVFAAPSIGTGYDQKSGAFNF